jgi:hypothetical protein
MSLCVNLLIVSKKEGGVKQFNECLDVRSPRVKGRREKLEAHVFAHGLLLSRDRPGVHLGVARSLFFDYITD